MKGSPDKFFITTYAFEMLSDRLNIINTEEHY